MINPDLALYQAQQVRELDRLAIEQHGVTGFELMQRAGKALWAEVQSRWPDAGRVCIVCGPGNNGGDGFVMAGLARQAGLAVEVVAWPGEYAGDAAKARQAWHASGGNIRLADDTDLMPAADVVVDALFGSGFKRPAEGLAAEWIERINASDAAVLAVNVPSGLQADTGALSGPCVQADATLSLVGWKAGLFTHEGVQRAGARALARLGLADACYAAVPADAQLMAMRSLPVRPQNSHKGHFGHVLVLGGEHGYGGAARLAGEAALRSGAGLVSMATRQDHVSGLLAARPELMAHGVDEDGVSDLLLKRASVLVAGPGLGRGAWGQRLFEQALDSGLPLVLDADGLNLLAETPQSFAQRPVVLTPHPGEAARLLDCDVAAIQSDRFQAARTLSRKYGCVVVLKGAGSLVAAPNGALSVCPWGNPGMASGGMGDVLAGAIGALMAQHLEPWRAACLGVALHARAGDRAAAAGQHGLLASDLLPQLRKLAGVQHDR